MPVQQGYIEREYKLPLKEFLAYVGIGSYDSVRVYVEGDKLRVTVRKQGGSDWPIPERLPVSSRPVSAEQVAKEELASKVWQKHHAKAHEAFDAEWSTIQAEKEGSSEAAAKVDLAELSRKGQRG